MIADIITLALGVAIGLGIFSGTVWLIVNTFGPTRGRP